VKKLINVVGGILYVYFLVVVAVAIIGAMQYK